MPDLDSDKANTPKRQKCQRCKKPLRMCHCHLLVYIQNTVKVVVFQHQKESKHALNTAQLLEQCLSNIEVIVTSDEEISLPPGITLDKACLLFPADDAITLSSPIEETDQSKASKNTPPDRNASFDIKLDHIEVLVVLDATWRKANKMLLTSPDLQALDKVQLALKQKRGYTLRKAKSAHMHSTLEAVAHSLAALESSAERYLPLLALLDEFMALNSLKIPAEHLAKMQQRI